MAYFNCRVFGVIQNSDGKILLIKRRTGEMLENPEYCGWELVGGGLEHGEDPMACVERECLEETGLIIRAERLYQARAGTRNGKPLLSIGFICQYVSGEVRLTDEHSDYKWVTCQELAGIEFGPFAKIDADLYCSIEQKVA
jgi:8-oxo-dGTP diphosphatase